MAISDIFLNNSPRTDPGDDIYAKATDSIFNVPSQWTDGNSTFIPQDQVNVYKAPVEKTKNWIIFKNVAFQSFTVNTSTNVITTPFAHNLINGEVFKPKALAGSTLPSPLTNGGVYFAREVTGATQLKLESSIGGGAIDITTSGIGNFGFHAPSLRSNADENIGFHPASEAITLSGEAEESLATILEKINTLYARVLASPPFILVRVINSKMLLFNLEEQYTEIPTTGDYRTIEVNLVFATTRYENLAVITDAELIEKTASYIKFEVPPALVSTKRNADWSIRRADNNEVLDYGTVEVRRAPISLGSSSL